MSERENIVRLWFNMWLTQQDLGIDNIFAADVVYTESWSPQYTDRETVKHWFEEWNTRGKVLAWDIKQFFHQGNQTVVIWYFKNQMDNGKIEEFDGISLIEWTQDNKIKTLKEFGCNLNNYNPYQNSDTPELLGSGEINHIGPGEKSQYRPDENRQSGVASPPAVLFTRPVVGQPVSR